MKTPPLSPEALDYSMASGMEEPEELSAGTPGRSKSASM
jgi:hypothetical protein